MSPRRALAAVIAVVAAAVATLGLVTQGGGAATAVRAGVGTGVVDVYVNLGLQGGGAAGTGMVLTSSGEVLTNNHVIRGATRIRVTDVTTGRSYRATVAGYDVAADVAVLRLANASGLQTVAIDTSSSPRVGDRVTAVGNAGGAGGAPHVARGRVTALHRSIVASDGQGNAERLSGLIQTDAPLQPGDSGGPLLSSAGLVIGMDTAASTGFEFQSGGSVGFAVPIRRATAIARQIEAGRSSAAVHVGPTAFLGVDVALPNARDTGYGSSTGALVAGVVRGSPAAKAGLSPGDTITSFGGRAVASPARLATLVLRQRVGAAVQLRWVDQSGYSHSAQVRTVSGPPQ